MASVEKRTRTSSQQQPDGTEKVGTTVTWLARWRDPDGHQRKASFPKRSEAARHAAAMEADTARGVYVDADDPTTVAGAARAWLARRTVRDRTRSRLDSHIRCHLEAVPLGSRRLAAVRPSEVHAWVADRGKVLAPTALRKVVEILRAVFADAVLDRRVAANPVVRISLPSVTRERVVPLSVAQVLALAAALATRYRAMVIVPVSGCGSGNCLGYGSPMSTSCVGRSASSTSPTV